MGPLTLLCAKVLNGTATVQEQQAVAAAMQPVVPQTTDSSTPSTSRQVASSADFSPGPGSSVSCSSNPEAAEAMLSKLKIAEEKAEAAEMSARTLRGELATLQLSVRETEVRAQADHKTVEEAHYLAISQAKHSEGKIEGLQGQIVMLQQQISWLQLMVLPKNSV